MYIIYKTTRFPSDISYSGPSWDSAGIRDRYKEIYDNAEEAKELAKLLTQANPVGFDVAVIGDTNYLLESLD